MMRRDVVFSAINRTDPPYVPIYFFNQDFDQSDIVAFDVQHHFQGPNRDQSEWGFTWERLDETMGQPRSYLLETWEDLPPCASPTRMRRSVSTGCRNSAAVRRPLSPGEPRPERIHDHVVSAGFEQLMTDIALAPERRGVGGRRLRLRRGGNDRLPQRLRRRGFLRRLGHAEAAARVAADLAQRRAALRTPVRSGASPGAACILHSCGQILEIVPDLIEAGVDILNISQPNLYDIPALAQRFRDQVCFILPVSYQTTSLSGTRRDLRRRAAVDGELDPRSGGLIGYVEEYHSMGMSQANYRACIEAFQTLGGYEQWRREQASSAVSLRA